VWGIARCPYLHGQKFREMDRMLEGFSQRWMMQSRAITPQGVQTVKLVLVNRIPGILQMEHGCQMGLRQARVSHVLHLNMNHQLFHLFLLLLHKMVMIT